MMQRLRRLRSFPRSTAAEAAWWWPSGSSRGSEFDRRTDLIRVHDPHCLSSRSTAPNQTINAATEYQHSARHRRLSRLNRHPWSHQSHILALGAPVTFPVHTTSRRHLLPLSQHLCRVCSGHRSSPEKESASNCSPSIRLFNACSLAGRDYKIAMVT